MNATTPRACVMGHPVAHSRSPLLHRHWLESLKLPGAYERADVDAGEFPRFLGQLRDNGYVGGNITIPHKEAAFRLVERRDDAARAIGAVNTVWYEGRQLVGGNTDTYGFLAHLDATIPHWDQSARTALVLGAGGAARAVVHGLLQRKLSVTLVNRTAARGRELAAHFATRPAVRAWSDLSRLLPRSDVLVNATSLGMAGEPPLEIDLAPLERSAIVYEIVYVPLETALLAAARTRGNKTVDGLGMLLHQAVPGFARWFGVTPRVTPELRSVLEADIRKNRA